MADSQQVAPTGGSRAAFAFVFVTVLLDMVALGIVIPVMPTLIVSFKGGDASAGAAAFGVFGTVWAAMQFLFSPVLGALSDRFGRRRVILLSNLGLGLDYILMAMAPSLGWLFVGRVISGITSATVGAASAYIADVTPPEQRAGKYGMLGAAFGVGFIVGPAVGGLLGAGSVRAPFWGAAVLSLANAAYGFFILPESLPPGQRAPFRWRTAHPMGAVALLRSHPQLFGLSMAGFCSMLAHDAMPALFVLYAQYRYGWDQKTIGLVLALVGVTSMIVQAGLVGRIVSALGEARALLFGYGFGVMSFVLYAWAPSGAWFMAAIPVGAFYGVASPALQGLMTRRVAASEQGRLQGAQASLNGIASMVAPLVFTQVFAAAIAVRPPFPGLPYYLAAGLLVAGLVLSSRAVARHG